MKERGPHSSTLARLSVSRPRSPLQRTLILFCATGAGIGCSPWVSGTLGTLAAVPFSLALNLLATLSMPLAAAGLVTFVVTAWWLCERAEEILQEKDSHKIVIDEVAGFLLANFLSPMGLAPTTAAFLLFRLFDILKPFPAGRAEKMPGGIGVLLDDLIAGLYAFLSVRLLLSWNFL